MEKNKKGLKSIWYLVLVVAITIVTSAGIIKVSYDKLNEKGFSITDNQGSLSTEEGINVNFLSDFTRMNCPNYIYPNDIYFKESNSSGCFYLNKSFQDSDKYFFYIVKQGNLLNSGNISITTYSKQNYDFTDFCKVNPC